MESEWNQRNLDHRDFQHSDRPEDHEKTRHKKVAKKSRKKKGCPENDFGAHVYVNIKVFGSYTFRGNTRNTEFIEIRCVGCDKVKNRLWGFLSKKHEEEKDIYSVEHRKGRSLWG